MQSQINKTFDIVIFHGPSCPDGICSYYCAKKYLVGKYQGICCKAGEEPEGKFKDKRILFVDLCPSLSFIQNTCKIAKKITILDHHKTAFDMYQQNSNILNSIENLELEIDMERAGCQITWDYFFPGRPRPWFIDYIADRDLWAWKLPNSKEINTALYENEYFNIKYFTKLDELLSESESVIESKKKELETEGKLILKIQKRDLDAGISNAYEAVFIVDSRLYNVWLSGNINPMLRSELGNILLNKTFVNGSKPDFSVIWLYEPGSNEWWISLRGSDESPDLSVISKKLGGGGHRNAAGFTIKNGESLVDYFTIK